MFRYIIRRINLFAITLVILTLVGYNLVLLDNQSHWLEVSYLQGWLSYVEQLLNLDFGLNKQGQPIIDELAIVVPATLEICIISFGFALFIGVTLGTMAGMRQGKMVDLVISFTSMSGYSAPLFWVALLLIMFFSLDLGWLPVSGRYDLLYKIDHVTGFAIVDAFLSDKQHRAEALQSVLEHLILPCLVLALAPTTQIVRLMRASVADVMTKNYIRAARIKGLSKREIITEHVLRNALPPIFPKLGVQLSSMLTFAIVTESIFNWPGIGRWLLNALAAQDYVSIQAGVMVVSTFVLSAHILSDLLSTIANPLIRKEWYVNR